MVIGIGIDAIDIERVALALKRHPERFAARIFTAKERAYCEKQAEPAQHFAVRFAAKEATLKALGTGWARGIAFQEIEVVRNEQGAPTLHLEGRARSLALELGIQRLHVSLTHTGSIAMAEVLAEGGL